MEGHTIPRKGLPTASLFQASPYKVFFLPRNGLIPLLDSSSLCILVFLIAPHRIHIRSSCPEMPTSILASLSNIFKLLFPLRYLTFCVPFRRYTHEHSDRVWVLFRFYCLFPFLFALFSEMKSYSCFTLQ